MSLWTTAVIAAAHITPRPTAAAAATPPAPTAAGRAAVSPATWGPAVSARRVRSTTSTSVPAVRPKASRCAAAVENAAVTSACATNQSSAKSTAPSASVTTSHVPDTRAYCAQVRWNNLFPYLVATVNFKENLCISNLFQYKMWKFMVHVLVFQNCLKPFGLFGLPWASLGCYVCAQCIWSVLAK